MRSNGTLPTRLHWTQSWLQRITVSVACALQSMLEPSAYFVQLGTAKDTHQLSVGLVWDWMKQRPLRDGEVTGYWELSPSGSSYPSMDGRQQAWPGQLGVVPSFRYMPLSGRSDWFAEIGVGAAATTGSIRRAKSGFPRGFNFADHIAVGLRRLSASLRRLMPRYRQHLCPIEPERHPWSDCDLARARRAPSARRLPTDGGMYGRIDASTLPWRSARRVLLFRSSFAL